MTSGKGLESLIPPSQQNNQNQSDENRDEQSINQPSQTKRRDVGFSDEDENTNDRQIQDTSPNVPPSFEKEEKKVPPQQNQQTKKEKLEEKVQKEDSQSATDNAVFQIETDKIKPNPYQPRKEYNQENLQDLANSIREVGIIQPLVVSKVEEETESGLRTHYQLISGERRLRASKLIGLERVPVIIRNLGMDKDKLSVALIENIQRDDLNPIEKARGYSRLQDDFNLTQREIATKVGKSRSSVANTLRLLNLPSKMQDALAAGKINESQARLLLSMDDGRKQDEAFNRLVEDQMSTKELRSKVRKNKSSNTSSKNNQKSREEKFWENKLEEKFGAPVDISKKGDGGKLTIKFFSSDEWKGILDRLLGEEEF